MLSDDDSASSRGSDIHQITVNEHFAKAYKAKKEHEELQKRLFLIQRDYVLPQFGVQ